MQPETMVSLGGFFVIIYFVCVIAIVIFVLTLLWRFVSAHERVAAALEVISRKMRDGDKP